MLVVESLASGNTAGFIPLTFPSLLEPMGLVPCDSAGTHVGGESFRILHCNTREHSLGPQYTGSIIQGVRHSISGFGLNDVTHHEYDGRLTLMAAANLKMYSAGGTGPGAMNCAVPTYQMWDQGVQHLFQCVAPATGSGTISGSAHFHARWWDWSRDDFNADYGPLPCIGKWSYHYVWATTDILICSFETECDLEDAFMAEHFPDQYRCLRNVMIATRFNPSRTKSSVMFWSMSEIDSDWWSEHPKKFLSPSTDELFTLNFSDALDSAMVGTPYWEDNSTFRIVTPQQAFPTEAIPVLRAREITVPQEVIGELSYKCIKRFTTFNGNGLAYSKDILTFSKFVKSALKALKGAVELSPKAIADIYLAYHYGIRLMIADTKKLVKAVERYAGTDTHRFELMRESTVYDSIQVCYSLYRNPVPLELSSFMSVLNEFDLLPTPSNVWDFIPYSFVVDWFFTVQERLERLEACSEITRTPLIYQGVSLRWRKQVEIIENLGVSGDLFENYYTRKYDRNFPSIPVDTGNPSIESSFSHWLEGAALVIQRIG